MSTAERKIVTHLVFPPIPIRQFDWCAWYEDEGEEAQRYGYGPTKEWAINDLIDTYGEDE